MKKILIPLSLMVLLTSCLKTRSELRGDDSSDSSAYRPERQERYTSGMDQQQRAQIDSRFFEIDRDFRNLYGKIEAIENKLGEQQQYPAMGQDSAGDKSKIEALEKRVATLEEALVALDKKINQMGNGSGKTSAISQKKPDGPYALGEMLFSQGKFEQAIAAFDKYRKRYPRGKHYAEATLKMGLSFQKLKMHQDAKAFYKEVIQRYPNTAVSHKAEANLKSI